MDNDNLATELLREVKASAKRWFIAFCIMVGLEIATVAGFMWYISLPEEETEYTIQHADGNSFNNIGDGGIHNGSSSSGIQE